VLINCSLVLCAVNNTKLSRIKVFVILYFYFYYSKYTNEKINKYDSVNDTFYDKISNIYLNIFYFCQLEYNTYFVLILSISPAKSEAFNSLTLLAGTPA